jgi:cyclic-di-AMP phosphodiesterase PgpH
MSHRLALTSKLTRARNAVLKLMLRPLLWLSPNTQLVSGFIFLTGATALILSPWPLSMKTPGMLVLVLASFVLVWWFVDYRGSEIDLYVSRRRAFALVGSAILVQTAVMRVGFLVTVGLSAQSTRHPLDDASIWSFALPFAAASLLVTMLLDRQLGLLTGLIVSVYAGILAPNGTEIALYSFISCIAAAYGIKRYRERQSVTLAGLVVAATNCVAAVVLTAIFDRPLNLTTHLVCAGGGIIGGLLTIVFAGGGVPINESLFGILTDIRLLELSNADLPILSQLAMRAPGTNQHSHAVGQLAEDACRAIGANGLLARVGALYHDIGKVAAPDHFVENQTGVNPHDRLRPLQSAKIITSHVTYGLRLGRELGLPKRVIDFIPQHHGTRTLHFFLRKAEAQADGARINDSDFRYPGPKPQFKEAAILMLADSCEAAARSLAHPEPASIRTIVARIFEAIVKDGQLSECNLTLRELNLVQEALINSLIAIYHPRIDYPGFNPPPAPSTPAELQAESDTRLRYERPGDVPINPSGEVEDEAVSRKPGQN